MLKPCPFCGCQPTLKLGKSDKLYAIVCDREPCLHSGLIYAFTKENRINAIKAWNTRSTGDEA